jgi:hypothetical protein
MTDPTPLSTAAQAVLDATGTQGTPQEIVARGIAAAALRAAAKCLEELPESSDYSFWCHSHIHGIDRGVEKLLTIASELEAQ